MSKGLGTDYGVFAAAGSSTPTAVGDPTDAAYDLVGFEQENSFNPTREMIESADKDSGADQEYIPGRRDSTISGTLHINKEKGSDAGQQTLWDNLETDNPDPIYWIISNEVTGDHKFYGRGYVSDLEVTAEDQSMMELSYEIQVDGGFSHEANA